VELKTLVHPMRLISLLIALALLAVISWQQNQLLMAWRYDENSIRQAMSQALISSAALSQEKLVAVKDKLKLQSFAEKLAEHPAILDIAFYDSEANLLAKNSKALDIKQRLISPTEEQGVIVKSLPIQFEEQHQGYLSITLDYDQIMTNQAGRHAMLQQQTLALIAATALMGFCFAFAIPFRKLANWRKVRAYNRTKHQD